MELNNQTACRMLRALLCAAGFLALFATPASAQVSTTASVEATPSPTPATPDAWNADEIHLIVTNGGGRAWRPYNPPEGTDAATTFREAVLKLAQEDPDALLLDQGGFTVPTHQMESAYQAPSSKFYFQTGFSAVNMNAVDYVQYGSTTVGAKRRDPRHGDLFLCALDTQDQQYTPLPAHKVAATKHGPVELMALTNPEMISGVPYVLERSIITPPEEILADVLVNKAGPAIAFSDFPAAKNDELARAFPQLDVVLEWASGPAEARRVGSTLIIPRGETTEFQRIVVKLDKDRRPTSATIKRTPWIDKAAYEKLQQLTLPALGMGVEPLTRLVERLGITQDGLSVDIHRNHDFQDLSKRQNINIFLVKIGGKLYHAIRIHHNDLENGWMHVDVIGLIDPETHVYTRFVTNLEDYPIYYMPTRFKEVADSLIGKQPEDWKMDPAAIAGYEEPAKETLKAFRSALKIERELYAPPKAAPEPAKK